MGDASRVSSAWKFELAGIRAARASPARGLDLPLRMAAGLGVARSRRNMAKNPQPQLPRSTGIRGIPGTGAEAVKIPPLSLLLSPFASPVGDYLCTRAYRKRDRSGVYRWGSSIDSSILAVTCTGKIAVSWNIAILPRRRTSAERDPSSTCPSRCPFSVHCFSSLT
jgi:hypothetical protein